MTDKLSGCPFCGSYGSVFTDTHDRYQVVCSRCFAGTEWYSTRKEAIAAWNRRTHDVVKCEECKFFDSEVGNCKQFEHLCSEQDFCGWGERKEAENG